MSTTFLFLSLRVVHVLLAALWIGATTFMSFLLMPAIDMSGPAGGQVMLGLNRKGVGAYFGILGGITVLTGFYLFWHFTGGFDPEVSRSRSGMVYGIGGVAGLLAVIIGGSIVGRSASKVFGLMERAATLPDGAEKRGILQEANGLRDRMKTFGFVVVLLQLVALVTMAIGHYV